MGGDTYDIQIAPAAERQLKKLERPVQKKVVECLESLSTHPRPKGVEKLSQHPKILRVRVCDYRIIYTIDDKKSIVIMLLVRHRRDAYRDLAKLDPATLARALGPMISGLGLSP
jgi:mRNA interferase RelE/StbE